MKIYLIHSSKYNFQDELYTPIKQSELIKKHEFIFQYDETANPGSTKEIIRNADLVIAEVSYPSIGSGIELGWADAFGIPIICIHKEGEKISQFLSLLTNKVFPYSDTSTLIETLQQSI